MKINRQYRNDLKEQSAIIFKMNAVHRDIKTDGFKDALADLIKIIHKVRNSIKSDQIVESFKKQRIVTPVENNRTYLIETPLTAKELQDIVEIIKAF